MPVQTEFTITYEQCGHTETADLSDRPAHKRAGFARWAAKNRTCRACWNAAHGRAEWVEDPEEWKAQQRAAELTAAAQWAERVEMPDVDAASDAQHEFAIRTRYRLLQQVWDFDVERYEEAIDLARPVIAARWWLDHREIADGDPESLIQLLRSTDDDGAECENTY